MSESGANQARETGQALDCHYKFMLWLIPTLARFPGSQKFLLGDRMQSAAIEVLEALIEATYTKLPDGPLSLTPRASVYHGHLTEPHNRLASSVPATAYPEKS